MGPAPGLTRTEPSPYGPAALWAGSSAVEHVTFNHVVAGSIPARLTKNTNKNNMLFDFSESTCLLLPLVSAWCPQSGSPFPRRDSRRSISRTTMTRPNFAAVRRALEEAGVIFVVENGEGTGVRLRKG